MPPLPLVVLLALYWSTQVCMRPLPGLSLAYFGSIAFGKTAGPAGSAGAAEGAVLASFGAAGAGAAAGGAAGVASAAHSAFRKSFHVWPFSVPASLAALYFALHSCMVSACAGAVTANAAKLTPAIAHNNLV